MTYGRIPNDAAIDVSGDGIVTILGELVVVDPRVGGQFGLFAALFDGSFSVPRHLCAGPDEPPTLQIIHAAHGQPAQIFIRGQVPASNYDVYALLCEFCRVAPLPRCFRPLNGGTR